MSYNETHIAAANVAIAPTAVAHTNGTARVLGAAFGSGAGGIDIGGGTVCVSPVP